MRPLILLMLTALLGCRGTESTETGHMPAESDRDEMSTTEELRQRADELAQKLMIIDTHIDIPYRLSEKSADISERTPDGDFDYVRARQGGLDVAFMSIYIPSEYQDKGGARDLADELIGMVEGFTVQWPDKFALARSVAEVRDNFESGFLSVPMGMENGAGLEGNIDNLAHFYERGIRYITLTHSTNNRIGDSSYDSERRWRGLSPFGEDLVRAMNRIGMMIDISHVSDDTFYEVIEITQAPVIASHSSCRHFTPGWERNMDDEMIHRLASNGGVIQINFGSSFLREDYRRNSAIIQQKLRLYRETHGLSADAPEVSEMRHKLMQEYPPAYADISDVVRHIEHVVELAGIEHVGIGSDFDGVGDSLPYGLKDVSQYSNLIYELLKKGFSEEDIRLICSENTLRVWSEVEAVAFRLQSEDKI